MSRAGTSTSLYSVARAPLRASIVIGWLRALVFAVAALVIGAILDRAVDGEPITGLALRLAALLTVGAGLAALLPITAAATSNRVESDLRSRILDAVLRVGPWSGRTGETVAKATEGVEAVGALAGVFLPQLVTGMTIPLLLAAVVAFVDWPTALVLVLVLPLIPLLLRVLEKRFASVSARYRETADALAARFVDGIQGMRTLKTLDRAEAYGEALAGETERLRVETMGLLRVNQLALLAVDTLFTLGTVVAAATMAALRLAAGAVTAGEAISIVLLGVLLIEPLSQIGRYFYVGAIGRAAAAQVSTLLTEAEDTGFQESPVPPLPKGSIRFDDVSCTYPDGTTALTDLSFSVSPGERVALVGPSGAGKTTIAHLILGLLAPDAGSVEVSGGAVLVPQRPYLFYGSVVDNLRLARPEATEAEMWAALEAADLAATVRRRSEGLDAQVGERGLGLSGGEVQRLAIARALLLDAPVVVLDEPTSNIDLESEARLRRAIDRLTEGRTLLVIAHRRSTIAGMDRILVVENGTLVETAEAEW